MFSTIVNWIMGKRDVPEGESPAPDTVFVYVKIPQDIDPITRAEQFERPLDAALAAENLGAVTGGGTFISPEGLVLHVGIDVDLYAGRTAVDTLRAHLKGLGVPEGTVLELQTPGEGSEETEVEKISV